MASIVVSNVVSNMARKWKAATLVVVTVLASALSAPSLLAHHNAGLIFDTTQTVTVQGKVTRFSPGNPHLRVFFTRTDGVGGAEEEWMAEGGSRTVLLRREWTMDVLKPGDEITIVAHPAREDRNVIHMQWVTLPDGRTIWGEDVPPNAREKLLQEAQNSASSATTTP